MSIEDQARTAAAKFRADHHLGFQPLGDLIAVIEQTTGIDVAVLPVDPDEHGLTMRDPARDALVIAVSQTSHPMRQRSTLAHELAHVVFKDWDDSPHPAPTNSPKELRARAFARHLLAPVDGVHNTVGAGPASMGDLSRVVQLFGVSPAIAARAMHDAAVIDADTVTRWTDLTTPRIAARFGWLDQYEALQQQSQRRRAPQKLLSRLIAGYVDNVVSAQTIATVRGQPVETVVSDLKGQGITPKPLTVDWADADGLPDVEPFDWDEDGDLER